MAAGLADLLRLGTRMAGAFLRDPGRFDPGAVGCAWARQLARREPDGTLGISLPGRRLALVTDRERSAEILDGVPGPEGYVAGHLKVDAMRFLAPGALTIADGERWAALRPFNERALGDGGPHPSAQTFLDRVRAAFTRPVTDRRDVQAAMGRAMAWIVLGVDPARDPHAVEDIRVLFDVVQSPLRRIVLGRFYRARRERLYRLIEACWHRDDGPRHTLLGAARQQPPPLDERTLFEQVPHWMFTFQGSGTDLLTRALALVAARPEVRRRVRDECAAAGPLERAETMERLPYVDACLLETGRLFPPVTRTFHRRAGSAGDAPELVHWFPLLQRDDALGATVHDFRPERWLEASPDAAGAASNLFLRGPRACPGKDLILFVCRAAMARQIGELGIGAPRSILSRDPLPISFPGRAAHFTVAEA